MITSITNQKIKRIVQLNKKAGQRKKEDVFVAEGVKMFLEAPENLLEEVYISEDFLRILYKNEEEDYGRKIEKKLEDCGYETVSSEVFEKMSDTKTPQGILCVLRQLHYRIEEMMTEKAPLFLVLENLQDPGNLGTMMRTGEGAGISGVIMSRDCVDIYNPKTIRATMGSVYRVPFCYTEDLHKTLQELKKRGIGLYAAHLKGKRCYDQEDYLSPSAFLIGNEGNGLTGETAALADTYIRIPMKGQLESLNAAVAAALLIYEAARQRRK